MYNIRMWIEDRLQNIARILVGFAAKDSNAEVQRVAMLLAQREQGWIEFALVKCDIRDINGYKIKEERTIGGTDPDFVQLQLCLGDKIVDSRFKDNKLRIVCKASMERTVEQTAKLFNIYCVDRKEILNTNATLTEIVEFEREVRTSENIKDYNKQTWNLMNALNPYVTWQSVCILPVKSTIRYECDHDKMKDVELVLSKFIRDGVYYGK